ncbi:MAG: hypothetical protein V7K21_18765 [Nostoc sp.]|uniref:hypothetical protein n=1 Tax=Nostoc sp. TaxID=1180 RepID=UPI002FF521B6
MAEANVEWGVLYNHITTFSCFTTGLSQLPNYLLTNYKETKTQRKKRRSHCGDFTGDRFLTNHRGAEDTEEGDKGRSHGGDLAIAFLTNHRGAEDTEEEEARSHGGVWQAIALFNELQRRREHRGRRGAIASHCGDFAGDRSF